MNRSFLLIKPDAYSRGLADGVRKDILMGCKEQGLSVVLEKTKTLTTDEVLKIYPAIFEKSFPHEFIKLMTSNPSTLVLVVGEDAITKAKTIRGYHKFKEAEETRGIRGKYCYVECVSIEEAEDLKRNGDPRAKQFIAVIIEGIIHAPDTLDEVPIISEIFGS